MSSGYNQRVTHPGAAVHFDVSVDLVDAILPPGMPPVRAAELVRAAAQAVPGAGWVTAEHCRSAPAGLRWNTTYAPGRSLPMEGGEWERVAAAVMGALEAGPSVRA